MIFKQIPEILEGRKTQTRRVCKAEEKGMGTEVHGIIFVSLPKLTKAGWLAAKWQVGRTYAVVPKRGQPAVWWRPDGVFNDWVVRSDYPDREWPNRTLAENGFSEMRIRITAIRREPLQAITEADARAEGVESVEAYRELWERINGKTKGARWKDNPDVWVLSFELVK
jgi:hypothetical protein